MTKKLFTLLYILSTFSAKADSWTQKAIYNVGVCGAVGFAIDTVGYFGTGATSTSFSITFRRYSPVTNIWTSKANFAGLTRLRGTGMCIDSLGYIGLGIGTNNDLQDWWQYSPGSNAWTQKADYGGGPLRDAVGFSIGNYGYVVTGGNYSNSVWKYDPSGNSWIQLSNFGGAGRQLAAGFVVNGKGYVGTGFNGTPLNDFWEYDPGNDTWVQRADLPASARWAAAGLSIGNKGYIGMGNDNVNYLSDFWEYDPSSDSWTQKTDMGGGARGYTAQFSIGNKGYVGTGLTQGNLFFHDLWQYTPDTITGISNYESSYRNFQIFPNPVSDKLNIKISNNEILEIILYDITSKKILQQKFTSSVSLNTAQLAKGIYIYEVRNKNGVVREGKVVKE